MSAKRQVDQRASLRAGVMGSAIVLAAGRYVGTYLLENLSASGALLVGDTTLWLGNRVRLLLQLHQEPRSFVVEARIVRHSKRGAQAVFGVQFVDAPAPLLAALQSAVRHRLDTRRRGVVLIVDAEGDDAARLERDIHEIGGETTVAPSPLDAIAWLQAPDAPVGTVIANGSLVGVDGLGLLEFIALDYPAVRRILACSADFARVHRGAATSGRVDTYLEKPWTHDSLLRALGRPDGPAL
jgi:CheY-like chemotaxis protein